MEGILKRKGYSARSKEQLEKFVSWLTTKNFDRDGGFLPHLKAIMGNPKIPTYSRKDFFTQIRGGYKVEIFEKLWGEFCLDQQEMTTDGSGQVDKEPDMDQEIKHPQKKIKVELPPFTEPFESCLTVVRAATWNCQQLRFILDEKMLDFTAHYLANSFDLILLQEIPPGKFGKYRLSQLMRAMNGGTSLVAPKFLSLLGEETTVNDTSSQLNAIIYPASWKLLHQASITSFLHPPVVAWFKPENGETIVAGTFHVSPSVGLASVSSGSSGEPGVGSTSSKATSTANRATVHSRLDLLLSKIVEQAQQWNVRVPSHLDDKKVHSRWILGGDLNVVPDSLPHGLVYTTPAGMSTVVASKRTLDGFIVDPLTAKAFNPVIDMAKVDSRVSDHNLVSLLLKEY